MQQTLFEALITAITSESVLALPQLTGQFQVEADSSDYAVGARLSQKQQGKWHPITYLSKYLIETQCNYEMYKKEMLAIMITLDEWRHYLIGTDENFEIWTDHQNLAYFRQPQKLDHRQACWFSELANYHYKLEHKLGNVHTKPDFLSKPSGLDKGENDNKNVTLLPPQHFNALHQNIMHAKLLVEAFPEAKSEYFHDQVSTIDGDDHFVWVDIKAHKRDDRTIDLFLLCMGNV